MKLRRSRRSGDGRTKSWEEADAIADPADDPEIAT